MRFRSGKKNNIDSIHDKCYSIKIQIVLMPELTVIGGMGDYDK